MATVVPTHSYEQTLEYLYGRINYERAAPPPYRVQNFKLERMRELLARLGDPHLALPFIHVAGTKGKGSTSSMLAAILTRAGYRTGLYTSPHLERTEERLAVDGEACSREEFVALTNIVRRAVDSLDEEARQLRGAGSPTYFEIMTAMALVHFVRRRVDAVVLEVGLGGRLDSTNVVTPLVSVITSISFDHMRQLGNTLALIAGEKAGIIKPGVPVIVGSMLPEPLEVITRCAQRHNSQLFLAGADFVARIDEHETLHGADRLPRYRLNYRGKVAGDFSQWHDLELGLLGKHQAANAALAMAVVERLQERGWTIPISAVRAGLASVRCPARIEVLQTGPTVILDTAHNVASIAALLEVLAATQPFARRTLIFACSKDKDAAGMLRQLWPEFDAVVLTRFVNNPRSLTPAELQAIAAEIACETQQTREVTLCEDPVMAWQCARDRAGGEDLICVTGSFFLAAELRSVIRS